MLPGFPCWLHSAGLVSDHLQIWRDGYVWIVGWVGQKFPSCSSETSTFIDEQCGAVCCRVAGQYFSTLDISLKAQKTTSSASEDNEQHWLFHIITKTHQRWILQHPKRVLMVLRGQGIVFGFFSLAVLFISQIHKNGWAVGGKNANYKVGEVHNVEKEWKNTYSRLWKVSMRK
jgi:hypothetical protein